MLSDCSDAVDEAERCVVAREAVGAASSTSGREVDGVGEAVAVGDALGVELESAAAAGLLLAFDVWVVAAFEAAAAVAQGGTEGVAGWLLGNGGRWRGVLFIRIRMGPPPLSSILIT